ncbi:hypothetical protein [Paenibacillus donghaensis]|uniref:Uncharacterized protein n=1 Tax=Paenibacillus donghaensis TaxID=414771 RepID=A0A2Z2KC92_9BACL|nr:hypothetical protein [Paenibacillus donghaensis]ASA23454.1 hypothetical protein B9T62_23190 [Paenibacillus donghaensis]
MSDYNTTNNQRAKVNDIRKQYLSREEDKMKQLKLLDSKVKAPGKIAAGVLGTSGALLLGAGMSNIMVWDAMNNGLAMGIPGLVIALLSYPAYGLITGSRKKKYADRIIKLSDELMK